jgi:ATP-dependent RNA helicase RhlE
LLYAIPRTQSFAANYAGRARRGLHGADSDSGRGDPAHSAGHDIIGIAQTGTGKTAAFVLPILMKLAASKTNSQTRGPRALVVAPTRELVVQIEENVRAYAKHVPLRMATVFGGVSERPQIEA